MPRNNYLDGSSKFHAPFPTRLRNLLESRNITQEQLARHLGVRRQTVGRYTDGSSLPNYEALVLIGKFFEVSIDYLVGASDVQSPDVTVQGIVSATGLSEKAVTNIKEIKKMENRESESFSIFVESDVFWDFIFALSECYRHFEQITDLKTAQSVTASQLSDDSAYKKYVEEINDRDLKLHRDLGKDAKSFKLYQAAVNLAAYINTKSEERWGNDGTEE